jgi:hypothetical protein
VPATAKVAGRHSGSGLGGEKWRSQVAATAKIAALQSVAVRWREVAVMLRAMPQVSGLMLRVMP